MGRGGWFVSVLAVTFLVLIYGTSVHGESPEGFISIDPGKLENTTSYTDGSTGIAYVPDFDYISSGEIANVSSNYMNKYSEQENDLRYFPNGTRNCYMIPVQEDRKYLVRATFFLGDSFDSNNSQPQFDLYLGINLWKKIFIKDATISYTSETIAMATSQTMFVCLVNNGNGIPFISSLELRLLNDALYPSVNSSQSLVLNIRSNEGGNEPIRYPADSFDRIWIVPLDGSLFVNLQTPQTIDTSSDIYDTPQEVMRTAISLDFNATAFVRSLLNYVDDTGYPSDNFYLILQFAEVVELTSPREFDVIVDLKTYISDFSPTYLKSTTFTIYPLTGSVQLQISTNFSSNPGSTIPPPLFNAYELYVLAPPINQSETFAEDGTWPLNAILAVKSFYKVTKNWMGDPCLPVEFIWAGLDCKGEGQSSPRIISLKLSSSGLTGEIAPSIANLTAIQSIDLSNNSLWGSIPDFFAKLQNLTYLDLSDNKLSGEIPQDLLERNNSGLLTLRVGGQITSSAYNNHSKNKRIIFLASTILVIASAMIL